MIDSRILRIVFTFLWIGVFHETGEVKGFINDVLNPVKVHLDVWHQRSTRVAIRSNEDLGCERQNVYTCEEPADTVPTDWKKQCTYRNQKFHEQVYRWVAGRGCLLYTPDFMYVNGVNTINLNSGCFYRNWFAPCLEIPKEDGTCACYPFDPGLEEVARAVREALVPSAHGRWEHCFYAAQECCSHYKMDDNEDNVTGTSCDTTFDGWTCWPATEAGVLANEACSEFAYSGQGPTCLHFSSKQCYPNGTWELQTDYSTCSVTPRLLRRYRFYIIVLTLSITSCLPAVAVLFLYKRLRVTRVTLHRNLLVAIVLRNALIIASRAEVYIDELTTIGESVMSTNTVACRVLTVTERIVSNAVFMCIFVEGIFMHQLVVSRWQYVNVKWLYGIGAVVAVAPVLAWATVMAIHDDHSCWLMYTTDHIQWLLDAPRVAALFINMALFIHIVKVMCNDHNVCQLSTAKSTLLLMPFFGCEFLLTAFRPNSENCTGEQIYYYIAYTLQGLQGFIVAMVYCYGNKEVHQLVKSSYKNTDDIAESQDRHNSSDPRSFNNQRITNLTDLPTNLDEIKDQYSTIRPKLHVAEIISIQASERLAEILDPVYETIDNGIHNEGYDSLERSDADNDSGFIPNRISKEDYYAFTHASSISIDCQDWIRCISSPSSSVGENNSYVNINSEKQTKSLVLGPEYKNVGLNAEIPDTVGTEISMYEDCDNMLDEIMQYMESNSSKSDYSRSNESPNNDRNVFVDDDG